MGSKLDMFHKSLINHRCYHPAMRKRCNTSPNSWRSAGAVVVGCRAVVGWTACAAPWELVVILLLHLRRVEGELVAPLESGGLQLFDAVVGVDIEMGACEALIVAARKGRFGGAAGEDLGGCLRKASPE
ncbi:hypothetical protein M758_12G045100 [Ceratodon purpureus]|nr:hypothetical protein M758_12G045100 [Ceratodon purpureus]